MNNMTWLLNQLGIRPPLSPADEPAPAATTERFNPIVSLAKPPEFDPIKDVGLIGDIPFDQVIVIVINNLIQSFINI